MVVLLLYRFLQPVHKRQFIRRVINKRNEEDNRTKGENDKETKILIGNQY